MVARTGMDGAFESRLTDSLEIVVSTGRLSGTYLFLGNGSQAIGLKTVASDRATFLVQLMTIIVPLVASTDDPKKGYPCGTNEDMDCLLGRIQWSCLYRS
jgi:hypothetical protein